ncbi:hypothetical protein ACFYY1_32160 [Streptomyces sp. NPDC001890]|uniref:hypothetical protein n=1 Tax=Streptomyces sp. NPDC001890 TaxID=3364620 RepID=UPI0036A9F4F7
MTAAEVDRLRPVRALSQWAGAWAAGAGPSPSVWLRTPGGRPRDGTLVAPDKWEIFAARGIEAS